MTPFIRPCFRRLTIKTPTRSFIVVGAALLAGPALAQSANVNSSGAVIAAERTAPRPDRPTNVSHGQTSADETAADNSTRVRAPAVTYLYESSNRDHIDQDAQADQRTLTSRDHAPVSTSGERALTEVSGSQSAEFRSGMGGGRYTFVPNRPGTPATNPGVTSGASRGAAPAPGPQDPR